MQDKEMNVLYVVSRLLKGDGPVNQALNLAVSLKRYDVNMTIVTLFPEDESKSALPDYQNAGVEVIQLKKKSYEIRGVVRNLKKLIFSKDIKVVTTFSLFPDIVGFCLRKECKVVTVQRAEFPYLWERRGYIGRILAGYLDEYIARHVNVVACSSSLAKIIEEKYGIDCSFIRNGVNIDVYKPVTDNEKAALRAQNDIPSDKRVFLIVGSLNQRKNVGFIIDAIKKTDNKDNLYLILGQGVLKEDLVRKAEGLDCVRFLGQIKNPLTYYQMADFYVSASLSEGFPNTVLEAIACGLPVILSDIPQHKEFFEYGNMGCLFELNDPLNLAHALNECKDWEYNEFSKRCADIAVESLSKYKTAENYKDYYTKLLKNRKININE